MWGTADYLNGSRDPCNTCLAVNACRAAVMARQAVRCEQPSPGNPGEGTSSRSGYGTSSRSGYGTSSRSGYGSVGARRPILRGNYANLQPGAPFSAQELARLTGVSVDAAHLWCTKHLRLGDLTIIGTTSTHDRRGLPHAARLYELSEATL